MNVVEIVEKSYIGRYELARSGCQTPGHSYRARTLCAGCAMLAALSICQAQPPSSASREVAQEQFICSLPGTSDRRIGIYRPPGGPQRCRVDYTRDGKTRSLWSAGHDYAFCVRKALEIVGLLEQASFKCSPQTREAPASAPIR
jgi:hypothetical protein